MIRGLLGGIFWGGLLGAVMLVTASLLMPVPGGDMAGGAATMRAPEPVPLPKPAAEAAQAAAAPASEVAAVVEILPTPNPEPEADTAPEIELTAVEPPAAPPTSVNGTLAVERLSAPDPADAVVAAPAAVDTGSRLPALPRPASPAVPERPPAASVAVTAPPPPPEPDPEPEVIASVAPAAEPAAEQVAEPAVPAKAPDTAVVTRSAPSVQAPVAAAPSVPEPQIAAEVPATPVPEASSILAQVDPQVLPGATPVAVTDAPTGIGQPVGTFGQTVTPGFANRATGVRVLRLPRESDAAPVTETSADGEARADGSAGEADAGAVTGNLARERYAVAFENAAARPLFSVVILDIGTDAGGLDRSALSTFPFPVTFAVPTDRPDADLAAKVYRQKGFEVVMVPTGLPTLASPSDLEVAFEAFRAKLPEAVAVMSPPNGGFQGSRRQSAQVVAIMAGAGYGLIVPDRGLNNAAQIAISEGVPVATIFRDLDADGGDAAAIRRTLDRAALRAGQEGSVVLFASSRPSTISALFAWALEGRAETVALAPISAVLRGQ